MNNDSIGAGTVFITLMTHLGKATGWINEHIIAIGLWLSAIGSILWMVSSFYKSKSDKLAARKSELEIKKLELEIKEKMEK